MVGRSTTNIHQPLYQSESDARQFRHWRQDLPTSAEDGDTGDIPGTVLAWFMG